MKRKKVWRYYCDYCKKAGCSGGHLLKHEQRCTLNPNRYCGFCHLLEQEQSDLNKAMELLPEPEDYLQRDEEFGLEEAVKIALPKLRNFVGNCPACIMAALRQKGIPVPIAVDFKFKAECKSVWTDFNEGQESGYDY